MIVDGIINWDFYSFQNCDRVNSEKLFVRDIGVFFQADSIMKKEKSIESCKICWNIYCTSKT